MAITVKILKRLGGERPALHATRDFDVLPVSIGRDAACSITLDDPHKHMSRVHVEIEEQDGSYWISVVSKVNPVTVKGRRYGPGARLALRSGDSFELADYEVQILLRDARPEPAPPPAADPMMQILMAETDPGEDEAERLFNEATFFGSEELPRPPPVTEKLLHRDYTLPEETFIAAQAAARAQEPATDNALRAFLEGAGLPYKALPPVQAAALLREGGAIVRAAVEGMVKLLAARAEMRKELGAGERAGAPDNNPLKRMTDPREALDFLFDTAERTGGLLDPVHAVGDAAEELRAHQRALLAGMRAAVAAALGRLDPAVLERAFDRSEKKGFSLASRKAKLWDLLVEEQAKLAREGFGKAFGHDFMSAYQDELRRLKGGR